MDILISQTVGERTNYPLGKWSGIDFKHIQSFTLASNKNIVGIDLKTGDAAVNNPVGNWTVRIETNAWMFLRSEWQYWNEEEGDVYLDIYGNAPSGTLAHANATATITTPSQSAGQVVQALFTSFPLSASTIYWIVVSAATQSSDKYWRLAMTDTNPYSGGTWGHYEDAGVYPEDGGSDSYFVLYEEGAGAYALNITSSSFSLTGNNSSTVAGRKFGASPGSLTLNGVAANVGATRKYSASVSSFSLSGIDLSLKAARIYSVDSISFSVTGIASSLKSARKCGASAGPIALSGVDLSLRAARKYYIDSTSFTLNGIDVLPKATRKSSMVSSSFSLTGVGSTLRSARKSTVESGSFSLAGIEALFEVGAARFLINASAASFSFVGISSTLKAARIFGLDSSSFGLTGLDVILRFGSAVFYLDASTGLFVVTYQNSSLVTDLRYGPKIISIPALIARAKNRLSSTAAKVISLDLLRAAAKTRTASESGKIISSDALRANAKRIDQINYD